MDNNEFLKEEISLIIVGHLTGNLAENDRATLQDWINESEENRGHFNRMKNAWTLSGEIPELVPDVNKSWLKAKHKLHEGREQQVLNAGGGKPLFRRLMLAASWIVFFALGFLTMYLLRDKPEAIASKPIVVSAPLGSLSSIILPDGSEVWLNAGTEIIYNQDYGRNNRSIDLSGEAYFSVAKNEELPFIVNVNGLKIRALGTRFNVKAYPDEETISATLEEGKIDMRVLKTDKQVESVVLMPNENVVLRRSEPKMAEASENEPHEEIQGVNSEEKADEVVISEISLNKNINTDLFTSWKGNKWIIEDQTLGELVPMLERRYNIKVDFKDETLAGYNFSGTIQNETIEQVISAIAMTAPINYVFDKGKVTLSSNYAMREKYKQITKP